ncbi:hypothetical protein BV22DRAFT_1016713 [Leucogyrophana mollusca]|uniref:Uncharacterized protein n=1 Tax=Leucogyrophana mollusca TaxID=85980 RepID=A0ACB8BC22_9AGAM|nr:hypothetical protein BV22DRAFT_1016713 [Leucogyrophana mollusca]
MPSPYSNRDRWKPSKKRSAAQKAHLLHLNNKKPGDKENRTLLGHSSVSGFPGTSPLTRLHIELDIQKEKSRTYERRFRNERKRSARKENAAVALHKTVHELKATCIEVSTEARNSKCALDEATRKVNYLEGRNEKLTKRNHALLMRVSRAAASKAQAVNKAAEIAAAVPTAHSYMMKEHGVITDTSREMVRDLVSVLDVGVAKVDAVIHTVSKGLGVEVVGHLSDRSACRIVGEGGVASDAQVVDEIVHAEGVTLSGDGTTHKNINYQSHHVTYALPDGQTTTRFVGVMHEVNHTSKTQFEGWKERVGDMYTTYNECMSAGGQETVEVRQFPAKVKGMLTDHAEDQKKLARLIAEWKQWCEREVRGEKALATLPPDDVESMIWEITNTVIETAGGLEKWDTLSADEREFRLQEARRELHVKIGQEHFASLSEDEKNVVDFFVWAGCCMHKELNAFKGGASRMSAWWRENGIEGPVILMNRDNAAAASGGSSEAKSHAVQVSQRGAIKAFNLAGSVFRHKDDKKGQQDSIRFYFEAELGYHIQWPDTSNTRYHSHGDAACEWLVNHHRYTLYLEIIMVKKESRTHTNIERNVYNAFLCTKTTEEVVCCGAYNQCITHPYLQLVRNSSSNILDTGPLHARVIEHLKRLITDINLVLAPDASYKTAALDGTPFERPEAFYAIQQIAQDSQRYPHVSRLLVAFFEGALATWERFCAEFAPGGVIANSTPSQRQLAHMKTTNDDNEGALGTVRVSLRRAPHMSLAHLNSCFMYKKNKTGAYIKKMGPDGRKYLRKKARSNDALGREKKRRLVQAAHDKEVARKHREDDARKKVRKDAADAKLGAVVPRLTLGDIQKLRVSDIDLQIRWHRQFDEQVPRAKDLPKSRAAKVVVLMAAVERYNREKDTPSTSALTGCEEPCSQGAGDAAFDAGECDSDEGGDFYD